MVLERYTATANKIGSGAYGLVEGKEYVLEKSNFGMWLVYDNGTYQTVARTDCFENYHPLEHWVWSDYKRYRKQPSMERARKLISESWMKMGVYKDKNMKVFLA